MNCFSSLNLNIPGIIVIVHSVLLFLIVIAFLVLFILESNLNYRCLLVGAFSLLAVEQLCYYFMIQNKFKMNIDAEKRLQEQRETYIATLSHDLKTPAIAQVRALELLLSGQLGEFNDEQQEILKLTLESCNYMYNMVYTILSTCKFESGEIVLKYSNVDLCMLVRECINEVMDLCKSNSISINFISSNSNVILYADRIELKRVIVSLLVNAINYAFSGTKVHILVVQSDNNIQLRVKSSSPYIEPKVMDKLFKKYVTHSEKYNKVGVGLGLYLSKIIVEAHQGKIIAESFKNHSNVFGFSIPIRDPESLQLHQNISAAIIS